MQESFSYRAIGSWWEPKGNQNEIDIVGVFLDDKSAVAVEVKRQKKNFNPQLFEEKVKILKTKELNMHTVESLCWDLSDM